MIKLTNIITEVMRDDMPQIKGKQFPEMLRLFKTYEIPYRLTNIEANKLKATQEDAIPTKVDAITKDIQRGKQMHPLLVSNDNYVIDGHHRWLAYRKLYGDNYSINVCIVDYPQDQALKLINKTEDIIKN